MAAQHHRRCSSSLSLRACLAPSPAADLCRRCCSFSCRSDPLLLLLLALALDVAVRRHAGGVSPVAASGRRWSVARIAFLDRRLNRADAQRPRAARARHRHGRRAGRRCGRARLGCWRSCAASVPSAGVEALVVAVLLAQRSLFEHVAAVGAALQTGRFRRRAARRSRISSAATRQPRRAWRRARGDRMPRREFQRRRGRAGLLVSACSGCPGLFAYKTANTLDSMIGHRSPRYLAFRLGGGAASTIS